MIPQMRRIVSALPEHMLSRSDNLHKDYLEGNPIEPNWGHTHTHTHTHFMNSAGAAKDTVVVPLVKWTAFLILLQIILKE